MAQIPAGASRPGQLTTKQTGDAVERARRWLEKGLRLSPPTCMSAAAKSI
jgi:putative endonuclease